MHAEMRLAQEIHRGLAPRLAGRLGAFEYAGVSEPSGEVGGDLIDVVRTGEGCVAYLCDISGHGVRSGVLMGMVKSAARMALREPRPLGTWLGDLNDVVSPLKGPSMFATVAAVRDDGRGGLSFTVAGHLPILRVGAATGAVERLTVPQIPVGLFEGRTFVDGDLACEAGDLLVLLTDGLTEVFDDADRELGLEPLEALLAEHRHDALDILVRTLIDRARAHGPQQDDQTVLLLRRTA